VLLYRSPVAVGVAFQNLMPAFVGLFTVPWLLLNLISGVTIPHQQMGCLRAPTGGLLVQGTFAGVLGGLFAAFFPVITGGVGGWLAGHATAMRDDRVFLVSQGASKFIYYVGGLLFFFLPGLGLTRGGAAWMMKGLYVPHTLYDYLMALAAISLATAVSFLLLGPLTRAMMALLKRVDYRLISAATLLVTLLLVIGITGVMGLFLMLVATGIGLLPVMFGSRRMNCLSVILLPMACNMSGVGPTVAGWLGLV
ncbi:MAG: tripartite tricarboxylate transporter permease, partial [Verrucomicrobia bacterium]|nr:tripartite tricarboxylate transporter permease [Verrucomicrobiota bacterium]